MSTHGTWAPGPQEITDITIGSANPIKGQYIENYAVATEGQSYDSAAGMPVDRGFVTRTITFDQYDYGECSTLEGYMTSRALQSVVTEHVDADTSTVTDATVRIMPIVGVVPDSCHLYIKAYNATSPNKWNDLATGFTSLGIVMSEPTFTFEFPFDGTDGCGRPYFGGAVRVTAEFELAGIRGATTDIYDALDTLGFGANVDVAIKLPNDNFLGLQNMYAYFYFGPESASGPRTVSLKVIGTDDKWSDIMVFTNGAASAAVSTWGTAGSYDPGDYFGGCNVELVAADYSEGAMIDWAT